MSPETTDRRVRRTRELLRGALVSLIAEKGYERITVQDLLDRADVGRSTFYAHYRSKDELLESGFDDIRSAMTVQRKRASRSRMPEEELLQPLVVVFRHVEAHRHLWKPLVQKGGADFATRILRENTNDLVHAHLQSHSLSWRPDHERLDAAVEFVTAALLGLLSWWLASETPSSAEEIHSTFRQLALPGVKSFLAAS